MKFFIDTASIADIKRINELGILDGVTTNPSLIAKESGKSFEAIIQEICGIVDGPISAEVIATEASEMITEGRKLAKIHKNVVVKVPLTAEGLKACHAFSQEGIHTNVTLCFSATQGLMAAKAGATMVSPFVGRLDDINHIGMEIVEEVVQIFDNYGLETQVLGFHGDPARHGRGRWRARTRHHPTQGLDQMSAISHGPGDRKLPGGLEKGAMKPRFLLPSACPALAGPGRPGAGSSSKPGPLASNSWSKTP